MEQLLGDPDLVDQANRYLKEILRRIVLTPDETAQHGLAVQIETDFASLLGSDLTAEFGTTSTHLDC